MKEEITEEENKWSVTRFLLQVFFHELSSPKHLKRTGGSFRIVSKIRGDIRKSRCTTGINVTGGKFATGLGTRESPRIFEKTKFKTILMGCSGAWGKLIHEKNLKSKISWHCPFKQPKTVGGGGLRCSWFYGSAVWYCLFLPLVQFYNEVLSEYSHSLYNILHATRYDVRVHVL
jgi:hypothetical protein